MGEKSKTDPGRDYVRARAIFRLTQRAVAACNLVYAKGPWSELTAMQNVTLRVALADVVRESIGVGLWLERVKNGSKEPPPLPRSRPKQPPSQTVVVSPDYLGDENPNFDEDSTTEPIKPR